MEFLKSIIYKRDEGLKLIDQTKLPSETIYIDIPDSKAGWTAIRSMQVRGAPAIAITAALSLAVEVNNKIIDNSAEKMNCFEGVEYIIDRLEHLKTSRPTAVNLFEASKRLEDLVKSIESKGKNAIDIFESVIKEAELMLVEDVQTNKSIGEYGANEIIKRIDSSDGVSVLTHCNTGSLATAGYGTALGVIRSLHIRKSLQHAYCTETRPYNQGSRLTALELMHENMPCTLITDSMASSLMKSRSIHGVIVGADRVAANGDTANKIGTYQLAIAAHYHNVPFYVAAPVTTLDLDCTNGDSIEIEERSPKEVLEIRGVPIAPKGMNVWNPAFDVTPAPLITGIITELGVIHPSKDEGGNISFNVSAFIEENKRDK